MLCSATFLVDFAAYDALVAAAVPFKAHSCLLFFFRKRYIIPINIDESKHLEELRNNSAVNELLSGLWTEHYMSDDLTFGIWNKGEFVETNLQDML